MLQGPFFSKRTHASRDLVKKNNRVAKLLKRARSIAEEGGRESSRSENLPNKSRRSRVHRRENNIVHRS